MPAITRPRGTNDLLPAEAPLREWVLDTHARVAAAHGYDPIDTPVFEATEMYERGTGAGTDVVEKEMFSFTDRGGRQLTLRPEGTPGVLRAVLGAHLEQERRPVRVHYAGPMFRYARPQAGRYHEFWQLGIEAIGERSPALDAEVIEVAWRFYEALGVSGLSLQVNTLGDIEDRLRYRAALVEYFTPLRSRLCDDCRRRLEVNPLRLLDCKRDAGLVSDAPQIGPSLSPESQGFFTRVTDLLSAAGIPFSLNPRLVRGLDYYAHTTFELWHESLQGAQNALGGGGRYDGLAEVLGFPSVPGSGYALGVERTLAVCREQGLGPAPRRDRVVVLGVGPTDAPAAARVA
ncbi:MAG: histidine--tRNA ligase, partial [Candidatus Dormiibacterota bacterium]